MIVYQRISVRLVARRYPRYLGWFQRFDEPIMWQMEVLCDFQISPRKPRLALAKMLMKSHSWSWTSLPAAPDIETICLDLENYLVNYSGTHYCQPRPLLLDKVATVTSDLTKLPWIVMSNYPLVLLEVRSKALLRATMKSNRRKSRL